MVSYMDDYVSLHLNPILYQSGYIAITPFSSKINQTNKNTPKFLLSCYLSSESVKKDFFFPK